MATATIHASAVLAGACGVLIRGPSGSGKSALAFALIEHYAQVRAFARLVADDRVIAEPVNGRLVLRTPPALRGLLEIRGLGIRRMDWEPAAVAGLVVDLSADDAARLPAQGATRVAIAEVPLARLAVAPGVAPLPILLGFLHTRQG